MEQAVKKKPTWVHATAQQQQVIKDLAQKVSDDVMRVMDTPLSLAGDEAGPAGIYALTQKITCLMALGSGMSFQAMREGRAPIERRPNMDDLLFTCLIAYVCEDKSRSDIMHHANELFFKIKGYEHPLPEPWKEGRVYQ